MTRTDHLLWNIAEECAEVAQRASKAARFGLKEVQAGQDFPNDQRIWHEMADLIAVMELWKEHGLVSPPPDYRERIDAKKARFEKFLELSAFQGRLTDAGEESRK